MNRDFNQYGYEEAARAINRAMERFPLILENLEELLKSPVPAPGDGEIRHGCERAITAILAALAKIDPPTAMASAATAGDEEQIARAWLLGELPGRLVDPARFARLNAFIDRLLPPSAHLRTPTGKLISSSEG